MMFTKSSLFGKYNLPTMKKVLVAVVCMGGGYAVAATWRNAENGEFTTPAKWNTGSVPALANEEATFSVQGAYTVTLPKGEWQNESAFRADPKDKGSSFTFDGSTTIWSPSRHDEEDYKGEPFSFYDNYSHFFSFEMYTDKHGAPFKLTHPVFRAVQADGVSQLHFDSGDFNFYDADGTAKNYDFTIANGNGPETLFAVHRGASAKVANVNVRSKSEKTTILVDGGELTAATKFNIPTQSGSADRTAVDIKVVSKGVVRVGEMTLGCQGFPRDISWLVADGGRLVFEPSSVYKFSQQSGVTSLDFEVRDGGTVEVGHEVGFGYAATAPVRIRLNKANWLISKETKIGNDLAGIDAVFAATNSLIDSHQGVDTAQMRVNGTLLLKDCVWTNALVNAYPANTDPEIQIEGGSWTSLKKFHFGGGAQGGTLLVDGGTHKLCGAFYLGYNPNNNVPTKSMWTIRGIDTAIEFASSEMMALGWHGQADVNMEGGILSCTAAEGISLGHAGASSSSMFTMNGGKIDASVPSVGMVVGRNGSGNFVQNGGDILLRQMYLGQVDVSDAAETCVFTQNGGTFTATDAQGITVAYGAGRRARVVLNGGELTTRKIAGGKGATAQGGNGWAALQANGGTLKASAASTEFVTGLDEIVLGEDGLTVDTDYDVTIVPALSALADTTGVLVKKGSGVLTLSAAVPQNVAVKVLEGTVRFGASSTLSSLTLGSAESAGAIALGEDVALSVMGEVTIVHNASTSEFSFEKDEDGVTRVTEDLSDAKTLEIRLDTPVVSNALDAVSFRAKDTLTATVVNGGTLNLKGRLSRGALVKNGSGTVFLGDANNEFYGGVAVNDGRLAFGDIGALGLSFAPAATLSVANGVVDYTSDADAGSVPAGFVVAGTSSDGNVVLRNAGDLSFGGLSATGGAFVKTGAGKATFSAKSDSVIAVNAGNGTGANGRPNGTFTVADDGTISGERAAFNVAEGEVVLKGTGTETVNALSSVFAVGLNAATGTAQPTLTVDGVTLNNNTHFFVGGNIGTSSFATNATLRVMNGATVKVDTLRVGTGTSGRDSFPTVVVDGSTLDIGFRLNCSDEPTWTHSAFLFQNGAALKIGSYNYSSWSLYWEGDAAFIFDASDYAVAGNDHYGDIDIRSQGRGSMLFRNGATAHLATIKKTNADTFGITLAFDNGAWIPGTGDYDFTYRGGRGITVDCRAGGLLLAVPEGVVWRVGQKFSGVGGVVKTGKGTLSFTPQATMESDVRTPVAEDTVSWAFTGSLDLREGLVSVDDGAACASAKITMAAGTTFTPGSAVAFGEVSGAGTVRGGGLVDTVFNPADGGTLAFDGVSLTRPTLKVRIEEGQAAKTFEWTDCSFVGRTTVDLGRMPETPLPTGGTGYVLGSYTGEAPDVSNWRVVNAGFVPVSGMFSAANGQVTVKLSRGGFMVIIR